ncbi:MAG: DUF1015 domain-containing protein [Bacteroidetes bacterium]|nr:DUF1015 domain-containing protein [Bacteroidota bacterium]
MPEFFPFKALIPPHEGKALKGETGLKDPHAKSTYQAQSAYQLENAYMDWVHKAQLPLGNMESSDPNYREEMNQEAKIAMDEILNRNLLQPFTEEHSYILYQSTYRGLSQTGIIGLCDATQIGKHILPHEQIRQDRAATITQWLQRMQVQWTPVFLSYRHQQRLHTLQSSVIKNPCDQQFVLANHVRVSLWRISEPKQREAFREAITSIPHLYIADGHHRAAACQGMSSSNSLANPTMEHPLPPSPDRPMLAILMSDRDLKIYPFYRRIRNDHGPIPFWEILDKLKGIFRLKPCSLEQMFYQYLPAGNFLLVHKEACWLLQPLTQVLNNSKADSTTLKAEEISDVQWLQEHVLAPICGINDPTTDPRIDFGSMNLTLEHFRVILQEASTEFILIPRAPSPEDVFRTADRKEFMPPKSTSFEPKIPSGLVVYQA